MGVVCIAIVGIKNNPIYLKTAPGCNSLDFHFLVHSSLDVIDEKGSRQKGGKGRSKKRRRRRRRRKQ